jgi:hypothetical protein
MRYIAQVEFSAQRNLETDYDSGQSLCQKIHGQIQRNKNSDLCM